MSPIFRILWALIDSALTDATEVVRRLALVGKPEDETRVAVYFKSLRRLALLVLIMPIPILALGIAGGWEWLVALVGIFWALATLLLLVVALPLGILIEALVHGPKGSGDRYVKLALGILLAELTFTLFRSVVPINQNPGAIPIVVLAAAILGILGAMGLKTPFTKKMIGGMATTVLVTSTLSFFFPQSFTVLKTLRGKIDKEAATLLRGEKPIVGFFKNLSTSRSESPPTAASQSYPICAGARDTTLTPKDGIIMIEVEMNPNCWSGWIGTPADWPDYYFQAVENRGMEIWFLDGSRYWLKPNSFPWFPNKRGIFRVRGEGKLIVSIEGGLKDAGDKDY